MPKLKEDERKEIPRRFWNLADFKMNERKISAKEKPFMMGLSPSVYYRRKKYPQELTLCEAIEISKTLKFTEEEIYRVIYGKSRESAEKKIGVSIANDIMQTIAQITARQTV